MVSTQQGEKHAARSVIRLDVHKSTNFERTLQATPSIGKWQCRLLIGCSDPASPPLMDGSVKNVLFLILFFSLRGFFFLSIITCPTDWVTVVQSAGKGSLFNIC